MNFLITWFEEESKMKSSLPTGQAGMAQATHEGMIIIATCLPARQGFHSLPRLIGVTIKKQL